MANCIYEESGYKLIFDALVKHGVSEEDAKEYSIKKGIATNRKFCSANEAIREYDAIHGGDSLRKSSDKLNDEIKLDISQGKQPDRKNGVGTFFDSETGQVLSEFKDSLSERVYEKEESHDLKVGSVVQYSKSDSEPVKEYVIYNYNGQVANMFCTTDDSKVSVYSKSFNRINTTGKVLKRVLNNSNNEYFVLPNADVFSVTTGKRSYESNTNSNIGQKTIIYNALLDNKVSTNRKEKDGQLSLNFKKRKSINEISSENEEKINEFLDRMGFKLRIIDNEQRKDFVDLATKCIYLGNLDDAHFNAAEAHIAAELMNPETFKKLHDYLQSEDDIYIDENTARKRIEKDILDVLNGKEIKQDSYGNGIINFIKKLIDKFILNKQEYYNTIEYLAEDIVNPNSKWFTQSTDWYGDDDSVERVIKNLDATKLLFSELYPAYSAMVRYGGALDGSAAIRMFGDVIRPTDELLHDMDFQIPFNSDTWFARQRFDTFIKEYIDGIGTLGKDKNRFLSLKEEAIFDINEYFQKTDLFKELKRSYDDVKVFNIFSSPLGYTMQISVDGEPIDMFFSEKVNKSFINGVVVSNYSKAFIAKLEMGRSKDIRDIINFRFKEAVTPLYRDLNDKITDVKPSYVKSDYISVYDRELQTNEIQKLIPGIKSLNTVKDREDVEKAFSEIEKEYGVKFTHIQEDEVWEKHRWKCNDKMFVDFLRFYSSGPSKQFTGSKSKWQNWKNMNGRINIEKTKSQNDIDKQYSEEELNVIKEDRLFKFDTILKKNLIDISEQDRLRIREEFADPRNLENPDISDDDKSLMQDVQIQIDYWSSRFSTISDIIDEQLINVDDLVDSEKEKTKAHEFMFQLSANLGVSSYIISKHEAVDLLEKVNVKFDPNTHCAFNLNGKIYIIKENLNSSTVLHEFSHPLIKSIRINNKELFDSLYQRLKNSSAWNEIQSTLNTLYGELTVDSDSYKEEALVHAMEFSHDGKYKNDSLFVKCLNRVIEAIKNILNKVFGDIVDVSDLSIDTTIGDLELMLENNVKFNLHTDTLTNDELAQFKKHEVDLAEEMKYLYNRRYEENIYADSDLKDFMQSISDTYEYLKAYSNELKNDGRLSELSELQTNLFGSGYVDEALVDMSNSTQNFKGEIKIAPSNASPEDLYYNRAIAFADSIVSIKNVVNDINNVIRNMKLKKGNNLNQEDVEKLYSYQRIVNFWLNYYNKIQDSVSNAHIASKTDTDLINKVLSNIKLNLDETKKLINEMYTDITVDTVYDQMSLIYEGITDEFNERRTELENNPRVSRKYIDEEYVRYYGMTSDEKEKYDEYVRLEEQGMLPVNIPEEYRRLINKSRFGLIKDKKQIREYILGNLGDTDMMNSLFEGYLNSTDPIIGGFAMYHKKMIEESQSRALYAEGLFQESIKDNLKNLNISKSNIGGLGKLVGFRDKTFINVKGEFKEVEVWTLQNEFKNYRADEGRLRYNEKKTHDEYILNRTDENFEAWQNARNELQTFRYLYMNQEYTYKYYKAEREFYESEIGRKAMEKRQSILDEISICEKDLDDEYTEGAAYTDWKSAVKNIERLKMKLRQLANEYDSNGVKKTGEDLEIAQAISRHNEKMAEFKEYIVDNENFDKAFIVLHNSLIDKGHYPGSEQYKKTVELWSRTNMAFGTDPTWNEQRTNLLNLISQAMEAEGIGSSDEWLQIFGIIAGAKDWNGNINTSLLSKAQKDKIMQLQDLMTANKSGATLSDYIKDLFSQYNSLVDKVPSTYYIDSLIDAVDKCNMTSQELFDNFGVTEIEDLADEFTSFGFDKSILSQWSIPGYGTLEDWFDENHVLASETEVKVKGVKVKKYTYKRAYFNDVVRPADKSLELKHEVIDSDSGVLIAVLDGVPAGRFSKSVVKEEFKTSKIVGVTVDNRGFFLPKNITELNKVTELDDNKEASNYRYKYINEQYNEIKRNGGDLYELIEKIKIQHLLNQGNASKDNRLYYDFPRYIKDNAETIAQVPTVGVQETLRQLLRRIKEFFQGSVDDFENGVLNYNTSTNINQKLVNIDLFEDTMEKIPVGGLYSVDADDCSTNILRTMWRYSEGCYREYALRAASPIAKAIETAVNINNLNSRKYKRSVYDRVGRAVFAPDDEKSNYRKKQINSFIETYYEGIVAKGFSEKYPVLTRIANKLMGLASFSFFAFNIPSAMKNSYGIKFQALLESSTNRYMNPIALEKGNRWSMKAMASMAIDGNYNYTHAKSFERMVIEQFDFAQDTAIDTFMDPLWRSAATDILDGKLFMAPRKWLEQQATYQVGSGMLFFHKVNYNSKLVDYMDVLEERDGKIRVKEGADITYDTQNTEYIVEYGDTAESIARKFNIADPAGKGKSYIERMAGNAYRLEEMVNQVDIIHDEHENEKQFIARYYSGIEYSKKMDEAYNKYSEALKKCTITIRNDNYQKVRNKIHEANNGIGGNYAKFDQPQLQRYFLYKMTFYLRKYFIPMFLKRFRWNEKINPGLGMQDQGYYIAAMKSMLKIIKSKGEYVAFMSAKEKRAFGKLITEFVLLAFIPFICRLLFGYDPDDDDRNEKLRDISGALPVPFTQDDPSRNFNLLGFSELHALHLLLQIRQENEQFLPGMGGFKQLESMTDIKSVLLGPTTDQLVLIMGDLEDMAFGHDGAGYYSRNVGPYVWQEKDDAKIFNHMMKWLAITGTSVDPALAIQNYEANRAKVRR